MRRFLVLVSVVAPHHEFPRADPHELHLHSTPEIEHDLFGRLFFLRIPPSGDEESDPPDPSHGLEILTRIPDSG